ncbi:hypothetical protein MMPV_004914 [Pyropia vietnamensis]
MVGGLLVCHPTEGEPHAGAGGASAGGDDAVVLRPATAADAMLPAPYAGHPASNNHRSRARTAGFKRRLLWRYETTNAPGEMTSAATATGSAPVDARTASVGEVSVRSGAAGMAAGGAGGALPSLPGTGTPTAMDVDSVLGETGGGGRGSGYGAPARPPPSLLASEVAVAPAGGASGEGGSALTRPRGAGLVEVPPGDVGRRAHPRLAAAGTFFGSGGGGGGALGGGDGGGSGGGDSGCVGGGSSSGSGGGDGGSGGGGGHDRGGGTPLTNRDEMGGWETSTPELSPDAPIAAARSSSSDGSPTGTVGVPPLAVPAAASSPAAGLLAHAATATATPQRLPPPPRPPPCATALPGGALAPPPRRRRPPPPVRQPPPPPPFSVVPAGVRTAGAPSEAAAAAAPQAPPPAVTPVAVTATVPTASTEAAQSPPGAAAARSPSPPPIPAELQAAIAAAEALSLAARSRARRSSSRAPSAGRAGGGRDGSSRDGDGSGGADRISGSRDGGGGTTASRQSKLKVTRAQVRAAARRVQHRFCVDVLAALAAAPFAAAFLRPVTELWGPEHIRGYASMVEVPCDLGTVSRRLADGAYMAPVRPEDVGEFGNGGGDSPEKGHGGDSGGGRGGGVGESPGRGGTRGAGGGTGGAGIAKEPVAVRFMPDRFADDVRLTVINALVFNRDGDALSEAARAMLVDFEYMYAQLPADGDVDD